MSEKTKKTDPSHKINVGLLIVGLCAGAVLTNLSMKLLDDVPVTQKNNLGVKDTVIMSKSDPVDSMAYMDQLLRSKLKHSISPGVDITAHVKDKKTGMYLVKMSNGATFYVDESVSTIVSNANGSPFSLYEVSEDGLNEYTDDLLKGVYQTTADNLPEGHGLKYVAEDEKYSIIAFVDPACAYCHKLTQDIDSYLEKGISVTLAPYPALGARSEAIVNSVWSLPPEERKAQYEAMEALLIEKPRLSLDEIELPSDLDVSGIDLVAEYKKAGRIFGFTGTPGIYVGDGKVIRGYVGADDIIKFLEKK